jgi:hypothetical protein
MDRAGNIQVAVIGIIAAVAGSLAGGSATYLATTKSEAAQDKRETLRLQSERRREERAQHRQQVGAARLLFTELLIAVEEMTVLEHDRIYRPFDDSFRIDVENNDLRLLLSRLEDTEVGDVAIALRSIPTLETFVLSKYERGLRRVSAADRCIIRSDIRTIGIAAAPIARLAELPGTDPGPTKAVNCSRFGKAFR